MSSSQLNPEEGAPGSTSSPSSHPAVSSTAPTSQPDSPSTADQLRAQKDKLKAKLMGKSAADKKPKPSDILIAQGEPHPAPGPPPTESTSPPQAGSLAQMAYTGGTRRSSSPFAGATSPGRNALRSASPRHLSPATSQIFERDVQESAVVPEMSPAIPSHIQTEDHIPPALDASSLAITDNQLGPDEVEIVRHAAHQPAVDIVTGAGSVSDIQQLSQASQSGEHMEVAGEGDGTGSTYGVDPADPRRLSFISFADVVHAEHVDVGRDSMHHLPLAAGGRSPSPVRSPLSQSVPLSPPMSGSQSSKGIGEGSPGRGGAASPASMGHGELTIETMRQALQQAGTNEAVAGVSSPHSAVGNEDGSAPRSFR